MVGMENIITCISEVIRLLTSRLLIIWVSPEEFHAHAHLPKLDNNRERGGGGGGGGVNCVCGTYWTYGLA